MTESDRPVARRARVLRPRPLELVLALPLALLFVWLGLRRVAGDGGLAVVADDEAALVLDLARGGERVVSEPGAVAFVPWFQEVRRFLRSPREVRLGGDGAAPRAELRANDGSSFWLEELSVRYTLVPERAVDVVAGGAGDTAFADLLVELFVRGALADELGRHSAEELVQPDLLQAAARRAQARLGADLERYGIAVLEIAAPRPRFDPAYETAIERRKVADQTVAQVRAKRGQLRLERLQREARARKEKELERRDVDRSLERERQELERNSIRVRTDADIFHQEHLARAESAAREKRLQAAVLTGRFEGEAAALAERLNELDKHGRTVVRSALVERLAGITFEFVPYARDSAPQRVEHVQLAGGGR